MDSLILSVYHNYTDIKMLYNLSLTSKTLSVITNRYLEKYKDKYIFLRKLSSVQIKQNATSRFIGRINPEIDEYESDYFDILFEGRNLNREETTLYYYYFLKNIDEHEKRVNLNEETTQMIINKNSNYIKQLPTFSGTILLDGNLEDYIILNFIIKKKYINLSEGLHFYRTVFESVNIKFLSGRTWLEREHNLDIDLVLLKNLLEYKGSLMDLIYL